MPGRDSVNFEVIVTCAVTGAGDTVGKHPGVPVTPEQIAQAAIDAAKAGATAAHLHVRDPATGKGSRDPELFKRAVDIVRSSGNPPTRNAPTSAAPRSSSSAHYAAPRDDIGIDCTLSVFACPSFGSPVLCACKSCLPFCA